VIGLYRNKNGSFRVQFIDGGEQPKEFDQTFTDVRSVENMIRVYLENHKPRKLKNVPTGGEQALQ
jgi:hypothetical protein